MGASPMGTVAGLPFTNEVGVLPTALADLRQPSGNRLEALRGDRQGQHSIRINDQYRICFV
jgi:RelE-like toxin of type II toxin-antitoxin system HigB